MGSASVIIKHSKSDFLKRCDAVRPACGPCQTPRQKSNSKRDPCVYSDVDSGDVPVPERWNPTHDFALTTSFQNLTAQNEFNTSTHSIPRFTSCILQSSQVSFPSLTDTMSHLAVIDNGTFTMEDIYNPANSALSYVSLDDLNMTL